MAYDLGLLMGQQRRWAGCQEVVLPQVADEPVLWLDAEGALWMWHPVMHHSISPPSGDLFLDAPCFRDFARQRMEHLVRIVRNLVDNTGLPLAFYSSYPDAMRKIHHGEFQWDTTLP